MKIQLTKYFDSNWFFISLLCFVLVLPFSQAFVSIFSGVLLLTSLIEDSWRNKIIRLKKNKYLLFIPAIYLIYILNVLYHWNFKDSLYDLNKSLFFLVIPMAFVFGKEISSLQKIQIFFAFALAIIISTGVAILNWKFFTNPSIFGVHSVSLISHIRFSFQLILIFWFFIFQIQYNYKPLKKYLLIIYAGLSLYFLFFLLFQQSLTGIIALLSSLMFFSFLWLSKIKKTYRFLVILGVVVLIGFPVYYVFYVTNKFYNIEKVDKESIDRKTSKGNLYWHDFENKSVENGQYVYLYICEQEMREEWNKISEIKYDSIASNGFPIHTTLMRYLTSKGLRKDGEGVKALNRKDIVNIENCIANVIFEDRKFSLYPRIYQTVWEYYTYSSTGDANNQSFSQRIEFARAAITIIKQNFWFGVGPGNWKDEFRKAYQENNSMLNEKYYASSHNQYLNYMVKFGIVGFVFIFFFILYPIVRTKKYRDHLFLIFIVFMFSANLADSNFESHMGSAFFVFFYCLFLVAGNNNYLKIKNG